MTLPAVSSPMTARLVESLYAEALLLADETHGYFDDAGRQERDLLPPAARVVFACESLNGTTRLMQVVAWLMMRRAIDGGEMAAGDPLAVDRRLGDAPVLDQAMLADMPSTGRRLLMAGADLYERVRRLDMGIEEPASLPSPVRSLFERLERAF